MSWKNRFSDYTTNIAFRLSLSKEMVYTLESVYLNSLYRGIDENFGRFVPSVKCLISRGLVEHHDIPAEERKPNHRWYTITPAGMCVVEMLKLSGLIKDREVLEVA